MFNINKILQFREELENFNEPVIVEGINDRKQLSILGLRNIITISGTPLHFIVEKMVSLNYNSVTILTDFDEEGEEKKNILTKMFQANGIRVNSPLRQRFKSLFKIHTFEELNFFTKFMKLPFTEFENNGKTSSIYNKIFNRSRIFNRRNSREARRNRSNIRSD